MPTMTELPSTISNALADVEDRPFFVATFQRTPSRGATCCADDDMPSNLITSRSNVPGMTPQELLAAHRMSLAEISRRTDPDLHSLTLSRHQVEQGDICHASLGDLSDEAFRDALEAFRFRPVED
ncbi:unspecified product [Leishmania tarentolae]|uniref:Unspecified product n=1 Tax=Leishmania tarentolae TaxID=5689 RepID=A0A640KQN4_LEITA|nr:unspecified product [Leishmania tarentolae]